MKRFGCLVFLALLLAGCGPSECEKKGGELVFDHYDTITTLTSYDGKTFVPTVMMVPSYKCSK